MKGDSLEGSAYTPKYNPHILPLRFTVLFAIIFVNICNNFKLGKVQNQILITLASLKKDASIGLKSQKMCEIGTRIPSDPKMPEVKCS